MLVAVEKYYITVLFLMIFFATIFLRIHISTAQIEECVRIWLLLKQTHI